MTQTCWHCGQPQLTDMELDKRARHWRARVRIYDQGDPDEPQADSDPEVQPDQPGTLICAGLEGVATVMLQMAAQYHGTPHLPGLDAKILADRIPGLRPTLSRKGGSAVWRVKYDTERTVDPTGRSEPGWLIRCDFERVADPSGAAPKAEKKLRRPA